jgi:uncharacterized damage-inducible protein DinB
MIHDDFPTLFAYNRWADDRLFEVLRTLSQENYTREPAPGWTSIRATVSHMGGAFQMWVFRLGSTKVKPMTALPTEADMPTVADAERWFQTGYDAWDEIVAGLTAEKLASVWSYRKLNGDPVRVPYWSVFRHVVNHATYHRGQVAAKLKRVGVDPPATDLIFWAVAMTPQGDEG